MKRTYCDEKAQCHDAVTEVSTPQPLSMEEFEAHVKRCQLQQFKLEYDTHGLVEEVGEVFDLHVSRTVMAQTPCRSNLGTCCSMYHVIFNGGGCLARDAEGMAGSICRQPGARSFYDG